MHTGTCRITGKEFVLSDWALQFLEKMDLPIPTIGPDESLRRRLSHRNERNIYRSKCGLTGKPMISIYAPDSEYTAYSQEAWYSDQWDARDYGMDFDFSRPFFEQFAELQKRVPHLGLMNISGENSEYCNITTDNKNCYLVFGGDFNEDCMYSCFSMHCTDALDLYWTNNSELCYECIDCSKCYNVKFAQKSESCSDSSFLYDCRNLKNCLGCVGLRGKEYHIFNQAYSKEDYEKKLADYKLDTHEGIERLKQEFEKFRLTQPHRANIIVNSEDCSGDVIYNSKHCHQSYFLDGPLEDLYDVYLSVGPAKDSLRCNHVGHKVEITYETMGSIAGYSYIGCTFVWHGQNMLYSDMCIHSAELFGCSNMNRAKHCILNKQYSEEEYFKMKARIIEHMKSTGEWGEFFPMKNSMFAYNETVANDSFPLDKDEVLAKGLRWREVELTSPGDGGTDPENLVCEETGRQYRILPSELKFYQKMGLPLPRFAPETRNKHRIAKRLPAQSWERHCVKCQSGIQTSFAPERPETIYCETCFMAELY